MMSQTTIMLLFTLFAATGAWAQESTFNLLDYIPNPENIEGGTKVTIFESTEGIDVSSIPETVNLTYDVTVNGVKVDAYLEGGLGIDEETHEFVLWAEVNKATKLTFGEIEWTSGGTVLDHSQTLTNLSFEETLAINLTNLKFSNPGALTVEGTMALVKYNDEDKESDITITVDYGSGKTNHTWKFDHAFTNGVAVSATQTGTASVGESTVSYTVNGIAVNTIGLANWDGTTSAMAEGWNLADNATVATDMNTVPADISFGETKVVLKASGTATFNTGMLTGNNIWSSGTELNETATDVKITGTRTSSGVKVNDENAAELLFEKGKKIVTGIEFATIAFENNGTARSFGSEYDLTNAVINAEGLTFSNADVLASGSTMTLVDATGAIQNTKGETLATFNGGQAKTYDVAFSDKVTDQLTIAGIHTDNLAQNDARTTLTYTVGHRVAETAVFDGTIGFDSDNAYYTADGKYTFNGDTKIDVAKLSFDKTTEAIPADASITLMAVGGITASNTIIGSPDKTVAVDYKDNRGIKFAATAKGTVEAAEDAVNFVIDGVAINSVDLANWDGTASTVTSGWTLAEGATIETDGMGSLPTLDAGKEYVILNGSKEKFFADATINGSNKYTSSDFSEADDANVVSLAGTQGKGITFNSNQSQLVYTVGTKDVASITIGTVEWQKGAALLDASGAAYNYSKVTALNTSGFVMDYADGVPQTVAAGDAMTLLKANETLTDITAQGKNKEYTLNQIAGNVTMNATLTGSLEANGGIITFKAASNKATELAFGEIEWTNGSTVLDHSQTLTNISLKEAAVNLENLKFSNTGTPDVGEAMTLVRYGDESPEATVTVDYGTGKTNHSQAFDQAFANGVAVSATQTGTASIGESALSYAVDGVAVNTVDLANWDGTASAIAEGWNLADNATIATDMKTIPADMAFGETKVVLKASGTATFNTDMLTGNNIWSSGGVLKETSTDVKITGTQTSSGVKVNDANAAELLFEKGKKSVTDIELATITFENNGTARNFGSEYDLTNAVINADGLTFSNADVLASGSTMTLIDATGAIQNANGETMATFNGGQAKTYDVTFSDGVTEQLTIAGTRTDELAQDAAKTTLTFTVGNKVAETATFDGTIGFDSDNAYYTADGKYTFNGDTKIDAVKLSFNKTKEAITTDACITLLANAEGITAANTVTGGTDKSVAVDYTDDRGIKFAATANGTVKAAEKSVNFVINGVAINSVDLSGWNGTTSTVTNGWALAEGATIETDGMGNLPALDARGEYVILQGSKEKFFTEAEINGSNKSISTERKESANGVTLVYTQGKGITFNSDQSQLVYAVGTKDVTSITIGTVEWQKGAALLDASGAAYNYSKVTALNTNDFVVSYASPENVAAGDAMTLLKANETLADMAEQVKQTAYSYPPVTGVTTDANITVKLEAKSGRIILTTKENRASRLTFTNVDWKDSGALLTRPKNIIFAGSDVDATKIHFQNIDALDDNQKMTLVSDFGDSVGTITGSKYTVGAGLEGEGAASLSRSDLIYTTKTGAGSSYETHATVISMEAGVALLAAGNEPTGITAEELGIAKDGTSPFANMGGAAGRYETGSAMLGEYNGLYCIMALFNHKFTGNNTWNTICLPFDLDLTSDDNSLVGGEARALLSAHIEDPQAGDKSRTRSTDAEGSTLRLTFDTPVTTLKAGVPYIIRWDKENDIVYPLFIDVLIENVHNDFDNGLEGNQRVRFIGLYDPHVIEGVDNSVLFMGSDNKLYSPDGQDKTTINSFQGYIKVGEDDTNTSTRLFTDYIIDFIDDIPTGIEDITHETINIKYLDGGWYSLDGRKLSGKPTVGGMYIHNGKIHVVR